MPLVVPGGIMSYRMVYLMGAFCMAKKTASKPRKKDTRSSSATAGPAKAGGGSVAKQDTAKKAAKTPTASTRVAKPDAKPRMLSGDNPQIPKGYGDEPVQAYIAAIPGWKQGVARRVDAVVTRTLPEVTKAVKWNSPLYGVEGNGWFLGIHCFAKYVKIAFFKGAALDPLPPGTSKQKDVRYLDIRENDVIDEEQFAAWVKQASKMQGEKM
jgi:hypothetical protein